MRNNPYALSSQRSPSVSHSQVMHTACKQHRKVREVLFGITEHVLDHARTLDSRDRVFNPHPHLRNTLIVLFLRFSQFAIARLFFGWYV